MSTIQVRAFRRSDRDQLTRLVNAHALAHVDRLLDYAWLEGTDPGGQSYEDYRAFLPAVGFRELTRTQRGWTRAA